MIGYNRQKIKKKCRYLISNLVKKENLGLGNLE